MNLRPAWAAYKDLSPKAKSSREPVAHAVILTTQEAEIGRILVQSQPRLIVHENLSQKNPSQKKDWWSGSRCRSRVQIPVSQKKTKIALKKRLVSITITIKLKICLHQPCSRNLHSLMGFTVTCNI
jgi:hypothetical protein